MKVLVCDRCKIRMQHSNKIHVYNYNVRVYGSKKCVNRPTRKDFDLCENCRRKLIKWMEE